MINERQILKFIDDSEFSRSDVLITLRLNLDDKPVKRGKLEMKDYADIMRSLKSGVKNSELAKKYKVTASRISEIKSEKSIPISALKSYLEVKYKE